MVGLCWYCSRVHERGEGLKVFGGTLYECPSAPNTPVGINLKSYMEDNHYLGMKRADYPELKGHDDFVDATRFGVCETCSAPTIGYMCVWQILGYLMLALPLVVMLILRWCKII